MSRSKGKWVGKCLSNVCYVTAPEEDKKVRLRHRYTHLERGYAHEEFLVADNILPEDLPAIKAVPVLIELLERSKESLIFHAWEGDEEVKKLVLEIEEVLDKC